MIWGHREAAASLFKTVQFKPPNRVIFVEDLPSNIMGKVQKNVPRETYKGLYGG